MSRSAKSMTMFKPAWSDSEATHVQRYFLADTNNLVYAYPQLLKNAGRLS